MARALKFSVIILIAFVGYTNGKTTKSKQDTGSTCTNGLTCLEPSYCDIHHVQNHATFECGGHGESLQICCIPKKNTTISTTSPEQSTQKSTTTVKPKKSYTETVWGSMPKNLQNKIKLLPESCGTLSDTINRITGGEDAEAGEFPWMVLIGREFDGEKQFWCGGTLITRRTVLTAAHCVKAGNFSASLIRLGEWNISSEIDCESTNMTNCLPPVIEVKVKNIIRHPQYENRTLPSFQNDIALITLTEPVNFTEYIKAICLNPTKINLTDFKISGWGHTKDSVRDLEPVLQKAVISLYDFNECNGIAPAEVRPLSVTQFCAGGDGINSCKGDSGGPLTYDDNGRTYQKGIVSLSTAAECESEGKPRIYTEVTEYITWILKNLA